MEKKPNQKKRKSKKFYSHLKLIDRKYSAQNSFC